MERKRISLTLKPSLTCSSDDILYLSSLFADLELAYQLRFAAELAEAGRSGGVVAEFDLSIGAAVSGRVHGVEEYGVVVDIDKNEVRIEALSAERGRGKTEVGKEVDLSPLTVRRWCLDCP
jgi:hypothetical protein